MRTMAITTITVSITGTYRVSVPRGVSGLAMEVVVVVGAATMNAVEPMACPKIELVATAGRMGGTAVTSMLAGV